MQQPCRFCMAEAHEAICLDCRSRFEALRVENERLRKQMAIYQRRDRNRYLAIRRKARPK